MQLQNLTWEEIENLDRKTVILPIGSTEQHGPHLPIFTDSILAEEIAIKCANKYNLVVAPLIPISCSWEHSDFPGTLYIWEKTLLNMVKEIIDSLLHNGFEKVILLNGHGGNKKTLLKLMNRLENKQVIYTSTFGLCKSKFVKQIHADEFETSLMMHLKPELVKKKKIKDEFPMKFKNNFESIAHTSWKKHTKSGVVGYPSKSSPEKGKTILEEMIINFGENLS